jgi:TctA family transporter
MIFIFRGYVRGSIAGSVPGIFARIFAGLIGAGSGTFFEVLIFLFDLRVGKTFRDIILVIPKLVIHSFG